MTGNVSEQIGHGNRSEAPRLLAVDAALRASFSTTTPPACRSTHDTRTQIQLQSRNRTQKR